MPTKTALTVVATSAPRTSSTSSQKSIATPTITTTLQTQFTSTQSVIVDSISATPSATASPSPSAAAVTSDANEPPRLTPAQIAGLSVAAVAAFAIAVGLMAMSVCLRKRKERKDVFDSDEKGLGQKTKKYSTRVSQWVPAGSRPEPPKHFPMVPPPAAKKGGKQSPPTRPVQRNGVGTSNSSSNSSLPLDQIGVAISEMDGNSVPSQMSSKASLQPQQAGLQVPFRPMSTMTQITVFEEDEMTARRRSSLLLPTPPVPVPPIRGLNPSKRASTFDIATGFPIPPPSKPTSRQGSRRSELFLDIPVRHERPQPRRIIAQDMPSTGSPQQLPSTQTSRLAPPIKISTSTSPSRTPASSTAGDIDDYYFSTPAVPPPRASPAYITRPRDSSKAVQIRSKRSGSIISRATSRNSTSTNIRDSGSSQTSFETADPSDPTPEDEDSDKQLSDDKLSPVAESPISNLRYPKVPRASNQLVPRSPKTVQQGQFSPRHVTTPRRKERSPPSTSHLLQNRRKDLAPLLLETRLPLKLTAAKDMALIRDPLKDPFTSPSPPRRVKAHVRSNSTESWTHTPKSKIEHTSTRKSRTQSGMWPASPAMYDSPATTLVLRTRRKRDEMKEINVGRDVDFEQGLGSPVWVPRLTPTRKGEDLFISVGWGGR
ncbi:hypothetical protein EK21DRAFT_80630 [Setomelanomma holmii]|uniref:Uncharacterized protein n=1 Tax=Setomelanomma holmii TaxID=210430 RepID=A0A9P4GXZ1_9PLEO|nr:hypothetical protein EK21DRAFT_80630 [Setomelanomma holmii]